MNRLLLFITCTLAVALATMDAQAQVSLGAKATVGTGNLRIDHQEFDNGISGENIAGFNTGLALNVDLNGWYFRPEALFLYRNGSVTANTQTSVTFYRMQFPLMGGLRLIGPVYLEGGPVYSRLIHFKHGFDESISVRKNGFGYKIGPMINFGNVMLLANYEGLITSTGGGSRFQEPYRLNAGLILFFGGQPLE